MSVELDPSELAFKRPFTHEVSQILRLHNPTSDAVAFKVKTTAPKQYCVRPNSGRIDAGKDVEVQVLLQAMKEDPPLDTRCRDKFLVQSVAIPADADSSNVSQVWSHIEATAKGSVQEKKIRVSFLPADGQSAQTNGVGAAAAADDEHPAAYSSPSPQAAAVTPQRPGTSGTGVMSTPQDTKSAAGADATENQSMLSSVSTALPTNREDLQRQLETANAKIKQLQEQASEGLRQRKVAGAEAGTPGSSTGTGLQNPPAPGGVSIPIVAVLCVLCFLLAYFFF
ncbi:hypothetical protein KC355_g6275 [Hortaea werneckii]|nr:hypothetical protein KC355_g6275 [Hortaea werneckii]